MKNLILLLSLFGVKALAQDYTPVLDQENQIGRIHFKENLSGDLEFVPVLFSQKFTCNELNNICTFQLYNQMNASEEERVRDLRATGHNTLSLRSDLFKDWVTVDSQALSGEITDLQSSFLMMKGLSLFENPYGSAVFRAPNNNSKALLNRYAETGFGSLDLTFQLKGVIRDFSIRIPFTELENIIENGMRDESRTFPEVKDMVRTELSNFKIHGYDSEDAVVIIAYQLKDRFLKSVRNSGLKVDSAKWNQYLISGKPLYWNLGESNRSAVEKCTVKLMIQKNSEMTENCEVSSVE